jgi:hypothetical protein
VNLALPNLYTRWTRVSPRRVRADILLPQVEIQYDAEASEIQAKIGGEELISMDPDTARMIGVRLIEAATRAEGDLRVRA